MGYNSVIVFFFFFFFFFGGGGGGGGGVGGLGVSSCNFIGIYIRS